METIIEFFRKVLCLPVLASEHGREVDDMLVYVHWLMIVLFIGWLIFFVYALIRFHKSRNPKADYVGVKGHASNYIEGAVAVVEGVLLLAFAFPLWAKAVDKFPKESESTVVNIIAQQFAWNVRYPGPDGKFGKQDFHLVSAVNPFGVDPADPNGKDDFDTVNEFHAPLTDESGKPRPVIVNLTSKDVIHSFKVIALRVCQDAIPGMRIPTHFTPTREGVYQINCAQLCGNSHFNMALGRLTVEKWEDYKKWVEAKSKAGPAQTFE